MHGTVPASAKTRGMGEDRKPENLFRGSDPQSLAGLVTFGHPALYGEKVEGREGEQDHMCHSLGKIFREHSPLSVVNLFCTLLIDPPKYFS